MSALSRKVAFFTSRQEAYIKVYAEKWQVTEQEALRRLLDDKIDNDRSLPADPLVGPIPTAINI